MSEFIDDLGQMAGQHLDPKYDDKIGMAWQAERLFGREIANRYLLEQGLRAFPEADGK